MDCFTKTVPRSRPSSMAATVTLWILLSVPGHATVLRARSIQALTGRSDQVVQAKVLAARGIWRGSRIYTKVRLQVHDRWFCRPRKAKGGLTGLCRARTLDLWTMGGKVGHIEQRVFGAPRLKPGSEVLLFLSLRRGGLFVTGMAQGAFLLVRSRTGTWALRRLGGVRWQGGRPPSRLPIQKLRALVRKAAASQGRPKP